MHVVLFLIFCLFLPVSAGAATGAENIVINEAYCEYTFVSSPAGPKVKAVEKVEYEAVNHSDKIVVASYYNNSISLDKVSGGKPDYKNVNPTNIFHDDSYLCYFPVEFKQKGDMAKTEFRRTFNDVAQFTKITISEPYPVRHKVIKIVMPSEFAALQFDELNIPQEMGFYNEGVMPDGQRFIIYSFNNIPAAKNEPRQPSVYETRPALIIRGYFGDVNALYEYHRPLVDVDTTIDSLPQELAGLYAGGQSKREIINSIFDFVAKKIRYVAIEEGEMGYRPDVPAEVLRKRFGDCKGMALLLATLLRKAGIEAFIGSVGTNDIPFKIAERQTLAATNHMICVVPYEGRMLFMDATGEYNSPWNPPGWIQGKDVMVFKEDGFELMDVPVLAPDSTGDLASYDYEINADGVLTGSLRQIVKGDLVSYYKLGLDGVTNRYKDDLVAKMIRPHRHTVVDTDSLRLGFNQDGDFEIRAVLSDANSVVATDEAYYVDLNAYDGAMIERIDVENRVHDYMFPFPCVITRRSSLKVPDDMTVGELPDSYSAECGPVTLSCGFEVTDSGRVVMNKTLSIARRRMSRSELEKWNNVVADWNRMCSQQVELVKKL